MDGPFLVDTFTLVPDADTLAHWLIFDDPRARFPFLTEARLAFVLSQPQLMLKGWPADGVIAQATVQGVHRLAWQFLLSAFAAQGALYPPDFVIYLDAAAWGRRAVEPAALGESGSPLGREVLVYHELSHVRQRLTEDGDPREGKDGRPLLALQPHTYEFFDQEVLDYGPVALGLEQAAVDLATGHRDAQTRAKRHGLKRA